MIYLIFGIIFLGVFLSFAAFFQAYAKEVGKAEAHVGFKVPAIASGLLKTTIAFSFLSVGFASLYLVYAALLEARLLL